METLYQNEKETSITSANRDQEYYLIYSEGHVNTEDFKAGFESVLADMKEHHYTKIVIDSKKVKSTPLVARTWLVSTFLPELFKHVEGNLQIGLVNSSSFFEGTTLSLLVKSIQALGFDLGIKFYKNADEARIALVGE